MSNILSYATTKNEDRGTLNVLYGVGGIGKTTIGASIVKERDGILIQAEEGLSKLGIKDIPRINVNKINDLRKKADPKSEPLPTWVNFLTTLAELATEKHNYKCIVIDTIDALVPSLEKYVVDKYYNGKQAKADYYSAKFQQFASEFGRVIKAFNSMMEKGIDVYVLGHSVVTTHKEPNNEAYQKWYINLPGGNKTSLADILYNNSDNFIFIGKHVNVIEGEAKNSETVAYTTWEPAYKAKHRVEMPKEIVLNIEDNFKELKKYI